MEESRKVVLIGKSGSGKSSLANSLFGKTVFNVNHSSDSKSRFSEAQTRTVNGKSLTLIDTPGIFNTDRTEDEVQQEIYSCYIQSSPGPHAFLFVLLIEKFTEQEQAIVDQVQLHFTDSVFQNATVVFTHGDQLQEGTEIMDFVKQSKGLKALIQKCQGRCHVIDNKYWKNSQDPYRNNSFQVQQILNSIDRTIVENKGSIFSNERFQKVEREIQYWQDRIHKSQGLSLEESRELAKTKVLENFIAAQNRWRYFKYALRAGALITALSFLPKFVSFLRGNTGAEPVADANEALPSSVMEVVQEVVAPIKNTLDYVMKTIEAIFVRNGPALTNKTLGLSQGD